MDIVFLSSPKYLHAGSTIIRSDQFHRVVAGPFADRGHGVICTADPGVRDALVVLSKGFLIHTDVEAIRALKARGNILVADFIDSKPDPSVVAEIDGLMASSHRQHEYLRSTFPDKPCHLVTHHVDTRIPRVTPPVDHLRVGYFGELINARHAAELRDLVTFVRTPTDQATREEWMSELASYNCHYGLRAAQSWDGFKPFYKGFVAAHCGAPIITETAEGDATYYLPWDYPFFVAANDVNGVAEAICHIAETFGGPEWCYACEVMREVRERSSVPIVIKEFEAMVSAYRPSVDRSRPTIRHAFRTTLGKLRRVQLSLMRAVRDSTS